MYINSIFRTWAFIALLLVCATFTYAASGVVIYDKQGEIIFKCLLAKKPVITFEDSKLVVTSNEAVTTLGPKTISQIGHIEFVSMGDNDQSIVERIDETFLEVPARLSFVFVDGQTVIFDGLSGSEKISVYEISGRIVSANIIRQDSRVTINLNSLSRGYYIVNIDHQAFKVFKK